MTQVTPESILNWVANDAVARNGCAEVPRMLRNPNLSWNRWAVRRAGAQHLGNLPAAESENLGATDRVLLRPPRRLRRCFPCARRIRPGGRLNGPCVPISRFRGQEAAGPLLRLGFGRVGAKSLAVLAILAILIVVSSRLIPRHGLGLERLPVSCQDLLFLHWRQRP